MNCLRSYYTKFLEVKKMRQCHSPDASTKCRNPQRCRVYLNQNFFPARVKESRMTEKYWTLERDNRGNDPASHKQSEPNAMLRRKIKRGGVVQIVSVAMIAKDENAAIVKERCA
jgi:hypothetical protein